MTIVCYSIGMVRIAGTDTNMMMGMMTSAYEGAFLRN